MGPLLASLLKLQSIEHDLSHVRRRLRSKENAIQALQARIDDMAAQHEDLLDLVRRRQADAGKHELELKSREEQIAKLRTQLNSAKTNKEYAATLTQINTLKAENSKLEDDILKVMQGVDVAKVDAEKVAAQIDEENKRLGEVSALNAEEIAKLTAMYEDLQSRRDQAAAEVPEDVRKVFDRLADAHDGDAMATVEIIDPKHGEFSCGGCYMSLRAEHYNALLMRDEVRRCESCGRILYLEVENQKSKA